MARQVVTGYWGTMHMLATSVAEKTSKMFTKDGAGNTSSAGLAGIQQGAASAMNAYSPITYWSLVMHRDLHDLTALDQNSRAYTPGLGRASCFIRGFLDTDDSCGPGSFNDVAWTFYLFPDYNQEADKLFTFDGWLEDFSIVSPVDGPNILQASVRIDGDISMGYEW